MTLDGKESYFGNAVEVNDSEKKYLDLILVKFYCCNGKYLYTLHLLTRNFLERLEL